MSETIHAGKGFVIEGERAEDRNTPFHIEIVSTRPIKNTKTGRYADLKCGHTVMIFGNVGLADGKVLCSVCRDAAKTKR